MKKVEFIKINENEICGTIPAIAGILTENGNHILTLKGTEIDRIQHGWNLIHNGYAIAYFSDENWEVIDHVNKRCN